MRVLDVYLGGSHVGTISENRKGGRFAYEPEIIRNCMGSPVLSLSFPVKKKPFGESKTASWFNGLLPEGPRRDTICKNLGVNPYDWMGLLAEIGWECAGSVQVFSHGSAKTHPASYREISNKELAGRLSDCSIQLPSGTNDCFRMSLGGFQEKLCVCMPRLDSELTHIHTERILLPEGEAASTHILKPENKKDYPGSAESEAWAMHSASFACRCAKTALLILPEAPKTLVVERYDRAGENWPSDVIRVHQEDTCQALGLDPSEKYANHREPKGNDPTYKATANLLIRHADDPNEELSELLRQMVVNLALGNWDAHAKNTSFLYEVPQLPTVAPLYDVLPISEVEPRTRFLSMRVDGCITPEEVNRKHVLTEAESWGIAENEAAEIVDECLEKLVEGIKTASEHFPDAAKRHEANAVARIERLLGRN